jgi:hypothetical protein
VQSPPDLFLYPYDKPGESDLYQMGVVPHSGRATWLERSDPAFMVDVIQRYSAVYFFFERDDDARVDLLRKRITPCGELGFRNLRARRGGSDEKEW